MPTTYEAVLRDNLIKWRGDAPPRLAPGNAVKVRITVLDGPDDASANQGQRMAEALERIAQVSGFAGVDAAQWERAARVDRPLPERDA